jgi:hypothetical protein
MKRRPGMKPAFAMEKVLPYYTKVSYTFGIYASVRKAMRAAVFFTMAFRRAGR